MHERELSSIPVRSAQSFLTHDAVENSTRNQPGGAFMKQCRNRTNACLALFVFVIAGYSSTAQGSTVLNVSRFPGDDAGAKIAACLAALPPDGGTCDARGLVGRQTAVRTVSIEKPVNLLLGRINLTLFGNPGIAIASSGVHIQGSGSEVSQLSQGSIDTDIISNIVGGYCPSGTTPANRIANLEIDHLKFQGIPGRVSACPNNGVDILEGSGISVHDNQFTGLREEAARASNSRNVVFQRNEAYRISDGFRFTGVAKGQMLGNVLMNSQLASSTFQGCFAVDSVSGTGYQNSSSLVLANNITRNMVNCQSFMLHDGQNVLISGNLMLNSGMGISLGTYALPDTISRITVQGNVYEGTCLNAAQPENTGININNNPSPLLGKNIVVTENQIRTANCGLRADNMAGVVVNYADDVTITRNTIVNAYGNGVLLAVDATALNLRDNKIINPFPSASGLEAGIRELAGGFATGSVADNAIESAAVGMEFDDAFSPELLVGKFTTTNVTTKLRMARSSSATIVP